MSEWTKEMAERMLAEIRRLREENDIRAKLLNDGLRDTERKAKLEGARRMQEACAAYLDDNGANPNVPGWHVEWTEEMEERFESRCEEDQVAPPVGWCLAALAEVRRLREENKGLAAIGRAALEAQKRLSGAAMREGARRMQEKCLRIAEGREGHEPRFMANAIRALKPEDVL